MEGTVLEKPKSKMNLGRKERRWAQDSKMEVQYGPCDIRNDFNFFHLFSLFAIGLELYGLIHYILCYFYFKFSFETFKSTIYLATQFTR